MEIKNKPKFNITDWLIDKLNINQKKEYRNKLLGFSDRLKSDLYNLSLENHKIIPILNGLKGDVLEENNDHFAIKMSFRYNNEDIKPDKLSDYYDFNTKNGNVCILCHGLMGDEYMWKKLRPSSRNKIGDWLENNSTMHILYVRYNTGLHISENGRALSNLLEKFIEIYGRNINKLNLLGHSMGGLVIRSAGYYADIQRQSWSDKIKSIFLIGVPNQGSYLAQIGFLVGHIFRKVDVSYDDFIAKFIDVRSNGIKDLSYAYLTDEDWLSENSNDLEKYSVSKVRPLENVKYYLIGAVFSKKNKIFNAYFGDGLVGSNSALTNELNTNNLNQIIFEKEDHLSLLESEKVVQYINSYLE